MTTHDLRPLMEDTGYCVATRYGSRVLIAGSENAPGYAVGYSYPDRELKWGETREWTAGLCGVIDNHGGTAADIDRERAAGRLFDVVPGDHLILSDSTTVVVSLDRRRYPVLTPVTEAK